LTGEEFAVDAVTPSGRAYRLSLARGDQIRFGIRCDISDHRVINGTIGTISDIVAEEDGHALIAADVDGRELLFSSREIVDDRGQVRLATDYASTIWSSQGLTSHSTTIVTDAAFDRRDIYVALSRAKQQSTLCVGFTRPEFRHSRGNWIRSIRGRNHGRRTARASGAADVTLAHENFDARLCIRSLCFEEQGAPSRRTSGHQPTRTRPQAEAEVGL
jgi:hypothetical protein